jgi:hypothetical protein
VPRSGQTGRRPGRCRHTSSKDARTAATAVLRAWMMRTRLAADRYRSSKCSVLCFRAAHHDGHHRPTRGFVPRSIFCAGRCVVPSGSWNDTEAVAPATLELPREYEGSSGPVLGPPEAQRRSRCMEGGRARREDRTQAGEGRGLAQAAGRSRRGSERRESGGRFHE